MTKSGKPSAVPQTPSPPQAPGDPEAASSRYREAWLVCFILGVVMLNYPFLHIFNKEVLLFGIPALLLYFLLGWPASIVVIYLFSRTLRHDAAENSSSSGTGNRHK